MNNLNTFDQVTSVTLNHEVISDKCQYYFSNVKTLRLITSDQNENLIQKPINIHYLKMIVNLSNLTCLDILQYESILLLDILKEAPQLSQIKTNLNALIPLFNNDQIFKYLKKISIYKYSHPSFNNSDQMKKFCEIFSNIEQLTCYVSQLNDVFFLINNLSKLTNLNVYLPPLDDHDYFFVLLEEESRKLNFIFRVKGIQIKVPELCMWIGRNIN
jgi:hypothetical protein